MHFLTTRELNLGTLFELFCERMGADLGAVCFTHKVCGADPHQLLMRLQLCKA